MFENHFVNKRTEIAVVLWASWYARNKLLHEGTNQRVRDLVALVRGYCKEIEALAESIYRSPPPQIVSPLPPTSLVKINVDASFSLAQRKTCSRLTIRDEHGQITGACDRLTFQLPTAFAAEALAAVHGLIYNMIIYMHRYVNIASGFSHGWKLITILT